MRPLTEETPDASERALFDALSGRALPADREGWRAVCEASLRTLCAPLLHARLQARGSLRGAPDEVVTRLARVRAWSVARWEVSTRQVAVIGRALDRAGARVLVLKGAHLGRLYAPGARATGDVDLLVDPERLDAARAALAALGYTPGDTHDDPDDPPDHRHLPPLLQPGQLPVELHWTLARSTEAAPWASAVWARAQPWGGEGPALGMEPLDALVYTCKHLAAHHLFNTANGIAGLADVHALLDAAPVDGAALGERADAWGVRGSVALCLRLARDWLGAPVSDELLAAVDAPGSEAAAASALWLLLRVGGFGLTRPWQLPTAATLNPPYPVFGIRNRPLSGAWAFVRKSAFPEVDDARLEAPRLGRWGYPVLWMRLGWRHAGLLRLADPRVRAAVRDARRHHRDRVAHFLAAP